MKNILFTLLAFTLVVIAKGQSCTPSIEPEWYLKANGSLPGYIVAVTNTSNRAAAVYDDGSLEIFHWFKNDVWESQTFSVNDLITPYIGPVILGEPEAVVTMDEDYVAVAYTTADDIKLVNIFLKDNNGFSHAARRIIMPGGAGSVVTDLALTQKRPDGSRFLFVAWSMQDGTSSGINVFRLDYNVAGDNGVVPVAESMWPCKSIQAIEPFPAVTDPYDALVAVIQFDREINNSCGSIIGSSLTLYGLDNNDGQFRTRATIEVPDTGISGLTSKGDIVVAPTWVGPNSVYQVTHNVLFGYDFYALYSYDPFTQYCDIDPEDYTYRRPLLLGDGAQFIAELFSLTTLIGARYRPGPDFSMVGKLDTNGVAVASSFNGWFCFVYPVANLIFITLPYIIPDDGSRMKGVAENQGSKKPNSENNGEEFSIYPNPTPNLVTISVRDFEREGSIEIIDGKGQSVMRKSGDLQNMELDMSGLKSGVYVIKSKFFDQSNNPRSLSRSLIKK